MLSMGVCTHCINHDPYVAWTEYHLSNWQECERVCCPGTHLKNGKSPFLEYLEVEVSIEGNPPHWCPYVFEHAVTLGMG